MASSFFPKVFEKLLSAELDLSSGGADAGDVKIMLLGNVASYTFDVTDEFVSDISGELANGTNGVAGYSRKAIPVTLSFNADVAGSGAAAGCEVAFTLTTTGSDNAIWTSATFTTAHAVLFVDKGGPDSANPLLYYFDLSADQVVSSGTFELRNPTTQPRIRRA
jgi:hypothetical protein